MVIESECSRVVGPGSSAAGRGRSARYINLDYAASAPALVEVWDEIQALIPWYSSVHRGAGFRSQVSTAAYEARAIRCAPFSGAGPDDTVIFTRNTTDAINLLADACPAGRP